MPRPAKGPRLVLLKDRIDSRSGKRLPDVWFIRDGSSRVSTGCCDDGAGSPPEAAQQALSAYITAKWTPQAPEPESRSDPAKVLVAEVIAFYAAHKAPKTADPSATAARLSALLEWWVGKFLKDVTRSNCEAYVAWRVSQPIKSFTRGVPRHVTEQGARRELEDLSAAIGWWDGEFLLTRRPRVFLPEKVESPRDALTRSEAAALLLAAMGWRKQPDARWRRLQASSRANRAHMCRFVLIQVYSGSRPGVTPKLLWTESATQAYVDLEAAGSIGAGSGRRTRRRSAGRWFAWRPGCWPTCADGSAWTTP